MWKHRENIMQNVWDRILGVNLKIYHLSATHESKEEVKLNLRSYRERSEE